MGRLPVVLKYQTLSNDRKRYNQFGFNRCRYENNNPRLRKMNINITRSSNRVFETRTTDNSLPKVGLIAHGLNFKSDRIFKTNSYRTKATRRHGHFCRNVIVLRGLK